MYFLTCFPFQWFFKRTGVRKHRWIGAGPVGAARGRLRTALEIFRSLGRPQDAEGFFLVWVVFFPFPPYRLGMFSSLPLPVLFL